MKQNMEQNRSEPKQVNLDYRTDEEALAEARTKKLHELTSRERGLLAVANSIEDSEDNKGTIYGQRLH